MTAGYAARTAGGRRPAVCVIRPVLTRGGFGYPGYMNLLASARRAAFGGLNTLVIPVARSRWSGPMALRPGLILVETTGRRTGRVRSRPLLSVRWNDELVAGTVRPRSDWVANLRSDPVAQVWNGRAPEEMRADVSPLPLGWLVRLRPEE